MIKVFEAFAGYGSQSMALRRLGIDFEVVGISEIDKYAIHAYMAVHGKTPNYGDISKIDWDNVPDFDLFTYSFPCGLAGTRVKTNLGYKNIEHISIGDKVLTHNNRYCEVIRTMSRFCPDYYNINAIGCKLKLTAEHPLYILRDGKEQWVKVKDLQKTDKLSYCIPQENKLLDLSNEELWLLGRYVADGFINKHLYNSVLFAIGFDKESEFLENIPKEYIDRFHKTPKTCCEYRIADKHLQSLCLEFGTGAKNKRVPEWLINGNKEQIICFLNGYFSGDGHVRYRSGTKVQMFTTVSKDLFLSIQMLILKCYGKVCSLSVRHDKRKETFNDTYYGQLSFSLSKHQLIRGERIFVAIKKVEKVKKEVQVFNLEVEQDNSYTCDNVNTHNCTDISSAGQQRGLAEGSGTRSSLLWECRKAIEAKRPKYLLMENVKNLVSKKFTPYLKEWIIFLEGQGYSNYTKVLNAKDFGVPQNRERVFMVSILGEVSFHFPKPFTLEKRLRDVLEKDVDESFYLSEKVVNTLLARNEKNKAKGNGFKFAPKTGDVIASSITAHPNDRPCDNFIKEPIIFHIGNIYGDKKGRGFAGNVYDKDGISPTIMTNGGGNRQPMIFECCNQEKKYGNKRVQSLVDSGKISGHEVQFLDAYNQTINQSNMSFISEPISCAVRGRNPENPSDRNPGIELEQRLELGGDIANCITTVQKDSLVAEPNVLTPKRTEYGKAMRKDYEAGNIQESRHNMTELEPRTDGISNTITTVQKDNLLVEPQELSDNEIKRLNDVCVETDYQVVEISVNPMSRKLEFKGSKSIYPVCPTLRATDYKGPHTVWEINENIECVVYKGRMLKEGDGLYLHNSDEFNQGSLDGISRTLKATKFDAGVVQNYRIRKLTPRECFRLMGVSEKDIDNIQKSGISKTQQYKMAGNSIVVDVLYYIFKEMFVDKSCEDAQLSLF